MSILNVTRALASNTNPTEAQFDLMRTYLLNFFNNTNLDETNIAAGGMVYSSLGDLGDDAALKFTSSHGSMKYVSASDFFEIRNTLGDIVFGTTVGTTLTDALRFTSAGHMNVGGTFSYNTTIGSQEANLLYLISRYRKPRLTYVDANIVTLEDNCDTVNESIVAGRDRLLLVVDRTLSLAVAANGYLATHAGLAVSGLLATETRIVNRWYYIYCVEVRGGTNATGNDAVLVATTVSPETANIATHNVNFGEGKWTYMGVIRNGYNDGTNTNVIVQFVYDEGGFLRFTHTTLSNEGVGVTLASTSSNVNLEYIVVIGNAADATIPPIASRILAGGHRASHGMEFHYRAIATDENHAITGGCYHTGTLTLLVPSVYLEVPLLSSYKFVCVIGNVITAQRIVLAGLQDHYL